MKFVAVRNEFRMRLLVEEKLHHLHVARRGAVTKWRCVWRKIVKRSATHVEWIWNLIDKELFRERREVNFRKAKVRE